MRNFFLILFSLFLVGCTTKTEYVYIKEKSTIDVPEGLYIHPKVPEPINKDKYLAMNAGEREVTLGAYILSLQKVIKNYKLVLDNVHLFIDEYNQIVERLSQENKDESVHK